MTPGNVMQWPYAIQYERECPVATQVLVLGGGIAGCWAAISAARKGLDVTIVDKADVVISGAGGAGCDHWLNTPNPCSPLSAEEVLEWERDENDGYYNGLSRYVAARESYDTLLELEQLGGKIRDTDDEFKGAAFRDEKTKFLFAYDLKNKFNFHVWGAGETHAQNYKVALYRECKRLGVQFFNRVQVTSLLTEGGRQGSRVIGATGISIRTGEFFVFQAPATILALSRPQRIWRFVSELSGLPPTRPHTGIGNGHAMAWRAGAEFTQMEKSSAFSNWTDALGYPCRHAENGYSSAHGCNVVDACGQEVPWVDRDGQVVQSFGQRFQPASGQDYFGERAFAHTYRMPTLVANLPERVRQGEFTPPFWVDVPALADPERRVIWDLAIKQEGKYKWTLIEPYQRAGFDPSKHQPQNYDLLQSEPMEWWRERYRRFGEEGDCGGIVTDWTMRTSLEGLYAAGDQLFASNYHYHAAATGRYAGRHAAEYARSAALGPIERSQVEAEKQRVYAPIHRRDGYGWKELNAGSAALMTKYCGTYKNEPLLKLGLWSLRKMQTEDAAEAYATDPHKLGRTLDALDILTVCEMIVHGCLGRKASSRALNFYRLDYPEVDPPEWKKWVTVKQVEGTVVTGSLPLDFWGNLRDSYAHHNPDYKGNVKE